MRVGSIDIGTNTILLLIADIGESGIAGVVHDEQVIARIGKGVDENRVINRETFHRAAGFLRTYRDTSKRMGTEQIIAVGTSALRDASNSEEFRKFILQETGIAVEILSGSDEAEWTCRGAVVGIDTSAGNFTVLDIGGGSTEIISASQSRILNKVSLDIGCVRVTERLLQSSPPTDRALAKTRAFIRQQLEAVDFVRPTVPLAVGVAGTVTTLAAMKLQLTRYDPKRIHGYELHLDDIAASFKILRGKTIEEIRTIPQISAGRADILLAGIMILLEFMEAAGTAKIVVSYCGLRYGILLREIERERSSH
jgi:exopolyphosphatase/guanosine-5'-triphosphate,3'-diphosphate pyrophosphatase